LVKHTPQQSCTLGLDIGGTKMAGCILTSHGEMLGLITRDTLASRGGDAVAADALAMVKILLDTSRDQQLQPSSLGLSVCELVDHDENIVSNFTLPWNEPAALKPFRDLLPVVTEADSRAAAFAEATCGAGKGFPSFLFVTIGTGISCSLVIDGKPYLGAHGCTGTMATGGLSTLCGECGTISVSCLEQMASGRGIENRYSQLAMHGHAATAKDILVAAENGDAMAQTVIDQAAECVGSAMSLLVSVLDPHAVIVGGGLGSSQGRYWDILASTTRKHIWSDIQRQLPILQGELGVAAGAIGAALKARQIE
jgi:predicted NBD/HSP70 family sugar kinase